jgi:tryptophan synthase alpha chain
MTTIQSAFTSRPALMPYLTLGYPDAETSLACVQAAADAGADLIELGVPFSDPLADGPAIQHSTQVALENGITTKKCLEMVAELRKRGVTIPLILMGYYNPIYAYGLAAYAHDAAAAGANGFIVPDLPLEESADLESACAENSLALIPMIAPTSTPARIAKATAKASGFIYLVSVTGVTGERTGVAEGLKEFVSRVTESAQVPVAVGFGISTPIQAATVGQIANGVIIGSAVIKAAGSEQPVEQVGALIREVRLALNAVREPRNHH